jgi:hypothetical protein
MKIMTRHSSATPREETSDIRNASRKSNGSPKINTSPETNASARINTSVKSNACPGINASHVNGSSKIIDASIKRRARLLVTKGSIPRQTRSLIDYALQIKDPYLAQVVRRVEAGEMVINCLHVE